ncbi:MAG: AAA-like domain-containing protein [Bacteroidales bacterium]
MNQVRTRSLKPCTIIPEHLYVERSADRQLAELLEHMGRPGYILVARQMGKTNLLLRAKRKIEECGDIAVYLDLSNRFDSPWEFFCNIIDTAIEVNATVLSQVKDQISANRRDLLERGVSPHKIHESELRLILGAFPGRVAVFLDEIDSLATSKFSDQIFSQIRSTYFLRTNYKEFERLTYILSGVAEPSDLIKDKSISPFNIGEKIYLDDFDKWEFEAFVARANLGLCAEVIDEIFLWTGGNPRMTWDVCAELEGRLLAGDRLGVDAVEVAVNKLYLTDFDRPPIDHIRNVVAGDPLLRSAVMAVKYGKGASLDHNAKTRLYLAGVTRSDSMHKDVSIKNKIIDQSLSDEWLSQEVPDRTNILSRAREGYENKNYEAAIPLYEEYISSNELDQAQLYKCSVEIGLCYISTGRFEKAIRVLEPMLSVRSSKINVVQLNFFLGTSYLSMRSYGRALEYLAQVIDQGAGTEYALRAKVSTSSAYLEIDAKMHRAEIIRLCEESIVESDAFDKYILDVNNDVKIPAFFNLFRLFKGEGDLFRAKKHIESAYHLSALATKPALGIALLDLEEDIDQRHDLVNELCKLVIEKGITTRAENEAAPLVASKHVLYKLLAFSKLFGSEASFKGLLSYLCDDVFHGSTVGVVLYEAGEALIDRDGFSKNNCCLFEEIMEGGYDLVGASSRHAVLRVLTVYSPEKYLETYINNVASYADQYGLEPDDALAFSAAMGYAAQGNRRDLTRLIIDVYEQHKEKFDESCLVHLFGFHYHYISFMKGEGDDQRAAEIAGYVLSIIEDGKFGKEIPDQVVSRIASFCRSFVARKPATVTNPYRNIGQNMVVTVRYQDGSELRTKFKKVRADVLNGLCEIV